MCDVGNVVMDSASLVVDGRWKSKVGVFESYPNPDLWASVTYSNFYTVVATQVM